MQKSIEHKTAMGSLSIVIDIDRVNEQRSYALTFFFEHLISCKTYVRTIKKEEMKKLFPLFAKFPGYVKKYIMSKPVMKEYERAVIAVFSYSSEPELPNLIVVIPTVLNAEKRIYPHPAVDLNQNIKKTLTAADTPNPNTDQELTSLMPLLSIDKVD